MRRTQAFIAVGVAVAVAAAVVVVGMNSGGGEAAGAAGELPPQRPPALSRRAIPPWPSTRSNRSPPPTRTGTRIPAIRSRSSRQRSAKDPTDVAVLLDLGKAYFMSQRLQQAEQAYSERLAQEPDNAMAQVGLALVWQAKGDSKRAETALHAVHRRPPR